MLGAGAVANRTGLERFAANSDPREVLPDRPTVQATDTINPLRSLPSILAIRDLRRRIRTCPILGSSHEDLVNLLALDPLTTLRCLRQAQSPVNIQSRPLNTISDLVSCLGRSVVMRALDTPVVSSAGTSAIRELWLHSLATAAAARALAETSGVMDPEAAYLRGLLHDIMYWLHYLGLHDKGEPFELPASQWIEQWRLPKTIVTTNLPQIGGDRDPHELTMENPSALIGAAELLAELADFNHPEDRDSLTRNLLLSAVTKESLVLASDLRIKIRNLLDDCGISSSFDEGEPEQAESFEDLRLFSSRSQGHQTELIGSLLHCSKSTTYRGIVTVATSAALRYLDFDRAFFVRWNQEQNQCWVKAKADRSTCPLMPATLQLTEDEAQVLRAVLTEEEPQLMRRKIRTNGLMDLLGADSTLVVAINPEFDMPTFLLLDRSITGRPIRIVEDGLNAAALGGTASILADNLRMRLERIRAQRFALIDPLTRLANRAVGLHALEREMARAKREGTSLSVLMIDLDEFKTINDRHGHLVGDQALRKTATVLKRVVRKSDIVCRYGGEEFLVVLPDTSADYASILATRLFVAVEDAGKERNLEVTVSIGLATLRADDESTDALVNRADMALYASKSRGKNRFSVDVD
jgi:diguanylate cyclase (GGDEF)-like protein